MRETRTMLFTDIEGSTRLARLLGDAWPEVLTAQRRIVRRAITDAGGRIEATEGDSFFATFASAERAVSAARDAQVALRRFNWPEQVGRLRVRMGIHTGTIERVDGHYVGVEVHRAARIGAAAHGGQTLLSEKAVQEGTECRDLGLHRLKDFVEPVRLYELHLGDERFPPPRTLGGGPAAELLERDDELRALTDAIGRLGNDGTGGVVLIEGPPGIGKTALLDAALAVVPADGIRVLRARGSELESVLAFGAARQLFAATVLGLGNGERDALLSGPAGLARPVLGLAPAAGPLGDPLFGLFWLAVELAESAPLVVAIDDLHWLDDESGRFAVYLAERLEGVAILLLATARPAEPGAAQGVVASIADTARVLRPRPLSVDAVGAAVHRATGGNPLFVAELSRALEATPGTDIDEVGPVSVARLVLARVARVSPEAEALARAVALFPDGASLDDAAALAGLGPAAAATAADGLIDAQVLTDGEPLTFLHPVMRRAVYDELGTFARRRGHAEAAARLKHAGAAPEAIAAHLLAGAPASDEDDMRILVAAADDAEERRALAAAARYLERALAEGAGEAEQRAQLRARLGRLQALLGRPEALSTLREAVDGIAEPLARADTAVMLGKVAAETNPDVGVEVLEQLRRSAELEPQRALAIDALMAILLAFRDAAGYEAAIARLPPDLPGETAAERHALSVLAYDLMRRGEPAASIRNVVLRSVGETGAVKDDIGGDSDDSTDLLVYCGALDVAEAIAQERIDRAAETGSILAYGAAQLLLSNAARARGDLRAAEASLRLAMAARMTPRGRAYALGRLAHLLALQGRFDAAASALAELETTNLRLLALRAAADIALARGDGNAALAPLENLHAIFREHGYRDVQATRSDLELAELLAGSGRSAEARELFDDYLQRADRFGEARYLGVAYITIGRHAPGVYGREHLERAHALLDPSPHRYEAARARLELGSRLRRDNERRAARELMLPALEYAQQQGVGPLEARLREELQLVGSLPQSTARSAIDALTPTEDRIARMAARGLSDKEIAQQLFLTIRAVETHLAHAFHKLGISARRELAAVLDESVE